MYVGISNNCLQYSNNNTNTRKLIYLPLSELPRVLVQPLVLLPIARQSLVWCCLVFCIVAVFVPFETCFDSSLNVRGTHHHTSTPS